ncbi:hypothetical protein [Paenibacillus taiwanensis]|uniref:hypothetical protein n=1 Tax=Paenibacillus taiwanensis TaxID=401638 RepID=UPI0004909C6F|nr:hypothetical protein [Paenibacillus taiwanensis]
MNRKKYVAVVLSFIMAVSMTGPLMSSKVEASAVKSSNPVFKPAALNKVNLTSKSYLSVSDVQFYNVKNDKVVYYTVTIQNNDTKSLNLMDYWFNIKSNTGEKYPIQLLGLAEKKDNLIVPNTSKTFKIYTKVNSKLNLYNLSLNVIKWDFSVPGFERSIGKVTIPTTYSNVTPIGSYKNIQDGDKKVQTIASSLQLVNIADKLEAQMTFYIRNTGDTTLLLNNYNYYLKTSTNKYYQLESEIKELSIAPGENKAVVLYAKLPLTASKEKFQLFISSVEGTENKVELPVGYYAMMFKSKLNSTVAAGKPGLITVQGQSISTQVNNTMVDTNSEYHNITMTYKMENKGKNPVSLPKNQYQLMTKDQLLYPLTIAEEVATELLPNLSKEIVLTASIPANTSLDGLKLVIKKTKEENKTNDYLIAQYQVPPTNTTTGSNKTTYVSKQGVYEVSMSGVERLPWDKDDLVNTKVTIKNVGNKMQPVPSLKPTVWLNGVKLDEKLVQLLDVQGEVGLEVGKSTEYILTTKVANDSKFNNAKIQLSEIIDGKPVNNVGYFVVATQDTKLPIVKSNEYYLANQPGTKASLTALDSNTYIGKNTNVINSVFSFKNTGDRYIQLPQLKAYYITPDSTYIPAQVNSVEQEISPNGLALLSINADVPGKYNSKDLKLMVGQGITNGKYATGKDKSDGYVAASILELPKENNDKVNLFTPIDIRPYTFKINKISANKSGLSNIGEVKLDFNYDLSQYNPYEGTNNVHKLVFQVEYNGKKIDKVFEINNGSGTLALGDKVAETFMINDIAFDTIEHSGFTLNIYDEVQGARKLLISHKVYSFTS